MTSMNARLDSFTEADIAAGKRALLKFIALKVLTNIAVCLVVRQLVKNLPK